MPILGIEQPEFIQISDTLRLRKYDGVCGFALAWYQDEETLLLVDGKNEPYTMERLRGMYEYLNSHGELYFIEALTGGQHRPIGDVTFWKEDMPIVIGQRTERGRGVGRQVVSALVRRGRELGYDRLYVDEIYDNNIGSRKCFEAAGFRAYEKTGRGQRYCLSLSD